MKSLVFDAGPVISLTTNNLLWLLEPLQKKFCGAFYIPKATQRELVTKPLETKKFKFEALQILQYVNKGVLKIIDNQEIRKKTFHLLDLANNSFKAHGHPINILHFAEVETLSTAIYLQSSAVVVDERTCRILIEKPKDLVRILNAKLHTEVSVNKNNIIEFQKETRNINIIRSVELVTVAYELGLLDQYIAKISNPKKTLLESVLWGVKLNGCAVSQQEIDQIVKLEIK